MLYPFQGNLVFYTDMDQYMVLMLFLLAFIPKNLFNAHNVIRKPGRWDLLHELGQPMGVFIAALGPGQGAGRRAVKYFLL